MIFDRNEINTTSESVMTHRNASPSFSIGGVEFRGVHVPATPEPAALKMGSNDIRVSERLEDDLID